MRSWIQTLFPHDLIRLLMIQNIKRALQYPSLLPPEIDKYLGRFRSKYEFDTDARVSPLCRIQPPDRFSVGQGSIIHPYTVIKPKDPNGISLGMDCTLHQFGFLSGSIHIGNHVRIANKVSIHSFDHGLERDELIKDQPLDHGECIIEDDVWIGTNVTILKDVHIGKGAIVAAGSVVTRDVSSYTIVAGRPAEPIGTRN